MAEDQVPEAVPEAVPEEQAPQTSAAAAEQTPRRSGWFRSPGGVLAHADGPSLVRAYTDRGYTAVDEADAVKEIGDGLRLTVDGSDGAFDAEAVRKAVAAESTTPRRRRPS